MGFWDDPGEVEPLAREQTRAVAERIGIRPAGSCFEDLRALYRAWGAHLGMENLSKRLRLLQTPDPQAVAQPPEATFESFLDAGTSGTCWATMEAFVALARGIGFDARPRLGEMTPGVLDHGAVVVVLDGTTFSVDQCLLWPEPLPLRQDSPTRVEGPHYAAEARFDEARGVFHIRRFSAAHEPLRSVLHDRETGRAEYFPLWRQSLARSYFNQGYFANRVRDGAWRRLDTERYQETGADGVPRVSSPPPDLPAFVESRFGISSRLVGDLLTAERAAGLPATGPRGPRHPGRDGR